MLFHSLPNKGWCADLAPVLDGRMADRILVLKNGELVEQGTHETLVRLGGLYSELFQLQAAGYR